MLTTEPRLISSKRSPDRVDGAWPACSAGYGSPHGREFVSTPRTLAEPTDEQRLVTVGGSRAKPEASVLATAKTLNGSGCPEVIWPWPARTSRDQVRIENGQGYERRRSVGQPPCRRRPGFAFTRNGAPDQLSLESPSRRPYGGGKNRRSGSYTASKVNCKRARRPRSGHSACRGAPAVGHLKRFSTLARTVRSHPWARPL